MSCSVPNWGSFCEKKSCQTGPPQKRSCKCFHLHLSVSIQKLQETVELISLTTWGNCRGQFSEAATVGNPKISPKSAGPSAVSNWLARPKGEHPCCIPPIVYPWALSFDTVCHMFWGCRVFHRPYPRNHGNNQVTNVFGGDFRDVLAGWWRMAGAVNQVLHDSSSMIQLWATYTILGTEHGTTRKSTM